MDSAYAFDITTPGNGLLPKGQQVGGEGKLLFLFFCYYFSYGGAPSRSLVGSFIRSFATVTQDETGNKIIKSRSLATNPNGEIWLNTSRMMYRWSGGGEVRGARGVPE